MSGDHNMNQKPHAVEAIGLVLATLNLDDVYPAQRELLREALEAAKKSQEQIAALTAMCETLNKLQETAVDIIKPAMAAAVQKERDRIVNLLMIQHEAAKEKHNYWHVAANLIQADVASDT